MDLGVLNPSLVVGGQIEMSEEIHADYLQNDLDNWDRGHLRMHLVVALMHHVEMIDLRTHLVEASMHHVQMIGD